MLPEHMADNIDVILIINIDGHMLGHQVGEVLEQKNILYNTCTTNTLWETTYGQPATNT